MDDIVDINTLFGPLPSANSDMSVDALVAMLQRYEIRSACTLSTLGMLLDPSVANGATRAACAEHPDLLPVATVNPTMYFGDEEAIRALRSDGFCMVRFFPSAQGWPVDFAPFRALLRPLGECALPLMLDIEKSGELTALMSVLDGYPGPIVLAGLRAAMLAEAIATLRERQNWHVEISCLLAPGCIGKVVETVGADRLLFGSRAPSRPILSVLNGIRQTGLPEEPRRQILAGNARRILGR